MNLATRIGEEFNLVRDEGMVRLNALAPYNGIIGTDTKQQQENLVFSTTVGNEYKLADTSRFRKIDGKVIDTYGPELVTNDVWTITTGCTYTDKVLTCNQYGGILKHNALDSTKVYLLNYNITISSGSLNIRKDSSNTLPIVKTLGIGVHEGSVVIVNGNYALYLQSTTGFIGSIDNISVREIQTIDFSRSGQHPFEVYTNTTLTAPNNVLAGDYVVVDNPELVTNGTFDTDASGWTVNAGSASVVSGEVKLVASTDMGRLTQGFTTTIGQKYSLSITGRDSTATTFVHVGTTLGGVEIASNLFYKVGTSNVTKTYTFTARASTTYVQLGAQGGSGTTAYFDNISVKLVDDTYRAKIDAPSGTALTNTTYFETRDYISNQVLAMQKADGTIHTETLFVDAYAVETTNAILASNGWSKLENGLYSKGTVVGTPVGYWQTLNKGAYHPVYNPMGTGLHNAKVGGGVWYSSESIPHTQTFNSFNKANDTTTPALFFGNYGAVAGNYSIPIRPNGYRYNIVYTDQFRDLRTNAEKANIPQLLNEVHNGAVNGSLGGYSDCVGTEQVTQTTTGTVATLEVGTKLKYSVGDVLQIWNGTTPYRRYVLSVSGTTVTLDSTIVKTAIAFIISGGKLPITSYKTSLTTDIIGMP